MFALIQKVSRNEKKPLALNLFSVTNSNKYLIQISPEGGVASGLSNEKKSLVIRKWGPWGLECFTTALRDTSPTRSGSRHQGVHGMLSLEPSENKLISGLVSKGIWDSWLVIAHFYIRYCLLLWSLYPKWFDGRICRTSRWKNDLSLICPHTFVHEACLDRWISLDL